MNEFHPIIVLNTKTRGLGVFANASIKKGERVVCGKPVRITIERTHHSFQIDVNTHVELDEPARLINHSCNPNLGIKNNNFGGYDFIAIKKIKKGEELTWDYCTTEYISIAVENKCLCKSSICRKEIKGFAFLPKDIKKRYNDYIANYLKI